MADVDGRTLVRLEANVDGLREDIGELCIKVNKVLDDHEERLRDSSKDRSAIKMEVAEIRQRQGILTGIQSAFTLIAATIAAAVGSRP